MNVCVLSPGFLATLKFLKKKQFVMKPIRMFYAELPIIIVFNYTFKSKVKFI